MSKIAIAQFWTNNVSYSKYTECINEKYCQEKNYTYYVEKDTEKINNTLKNRAATWYKPILILEAFEKTKSEYILFLDADAIVCDFTYNIEDFIEEGVDIICTEDYGPSIMNAGVLLIKNTDWAIDFLYAWWRIGETSVGGPNNEVGYYLNGLWHDQTCFGILMDQIKESKEKIKIIPNTILNGRTYKHPIDKNYIFHAFSYGMIKYRTLDLCYYDIFQIEKPGHKELLSEMVSSYHTDKHYGHNYFSLIYDELFKNIKNTVKLFIEIGIDRGESLKLWRDYFINSQIIGVDINTSPAISNIENKDRIDIITADQSNIKDLVELANKYKDVDVILDDGSHKMLDQQITFAELFKSLKPGGIYVMEDLHTSLEVIMPEKHIFNWGDPEKTTSLDMLKKYINTGNIESDYISQEDAEYLNNNIKSVEIYQSTPNWSITGIIIKK